MEPQQPRAWILCLERLAHLMRPNTTRSAIFCDLFEEIIMCVEEEGETRREFIHVHAACDAPSHIFESICERKGQFLRGCRARFTDVISTDGDRVPLRNFLRAELHRVDDQSHRRLGWEDKFLLRDEFLEDVVLCGTAQLIGTHS